MQHIEHLSHQLDRISNQQVKVNGLSGQATLDLIPYNGLDFSRLAFLFCGQGQMAAGLMNQEVRNHPLFKARFEELDSVCADLNFPKPSAFVLDPESIDFNFAADFSVLSLFTLQISMFETLLFNKYFPTLLSAHSFGEFAMLTASGCLSFRDGVKLIIERQKTLSSMKGGFTMFAVNNAEKMQQVKLDFEFYPANINTTSQITYVCREEDFVEIKRVLRGYKIACVKVNVDYPYHTPWLQKPRAKLKSYLQAADFAFQPPKIPFISSVTGELIADDNFSAELIRELIVDQFVKQVNFPKQLQLIRSANVAHFVEISPVDVLTPFVEQTMTLAEQAYKVSSFKRKIKRAAGKKQNFEKFKDSRVLDVFNKALKTLTGYSIEDIQLEDRIREDLGIDSIKKAEIVFEIVDSINVNAENNSAPLNLAELSTFGDILDYFDRSLKAQKSSTMMSEQKDTRFSLINKRYVSRPLVDYSSYDFASLTRIRLQELRRESVKMVNSEVLVFECFDFADRDLFNECQWWVHFFKHNEIPSKRVVLLHDNSLMASMLSSFLVSLAQEKNFSFKSITSDRMSPLTDHQLYCESLDFFSSEVHYRKNERLIKEYQVAEPKVPFQQSVKNIVAFGGLGGIGRHLLAGLSQYSPENIWIVGRRPNSTDVENEISRLGISDCQIKYFSLRVSDEVTVFDLLQKAMQEFGSIDLILHSVGQEFSELLADTTSEQISGTLGPKMALAQTLSQWAKANPSTQVVFNSSVIAEFGNIGQAPYAMVNRYLDRLAELGDNLTSLLWPAWEGIGMAGDSFIAKSLKLQGLPAVRPADGTQLFLQSLARGPGIYYVLSSAFMPDYFAVNQSRSEIKDLFKGASKNRQMYVLSGLTQERLPYLKDHLVKKVCLFPASGSIGLMAFRGYQEKGALANINNFSAHNFLIVGQESSNYFLEAVGKDQDQMYLQVKSNQLIAESTLDFATVGSAKLCHSQITTDYVIESEFDQNIAVYIGPDFKLDQGVYYSSQQDELLLEINLAKSPRYTGVEILDKVHKLVEASFHSACLKSLLDHALMVVPKTIAKIEFFSENMHDHLFYPAVQEIVPVENGCMCNINTFNSRGELAFAIHDLRMILVKQYSEHDNILHKVKKQNQIF